VRVCRLFIFAIAWFGAALPAVADPRVDEIVTFIDDVALNHTRPDGQTPEPVRRWVRPVVVELIGDKTEVYRNNVANHVADIARWTGLSMRLLAKGESGGNLTITILDADGMAPHRRGRPKPECLTKWRLVKQTFAEAHLFLEDRFAHCLAHELMHAFGFFSHPRSGYTISALRGGKPVYWHRTFTGWDEIAFKVLYSPELKPGMSRDETLPIVRRLVAEHVAKDPAVLAR
jgi:hypothetical protein